MKTTSKKFVSLLLVLVMAFSLAVPAFAANNPEITGMTGDGVEFTLGSFTYQNPVTGEEFTSYTAAAEFENRTDFSSVNVTIAYNGTALKVNGTQVSTGGTYTGVIDFSNSVVEIEVVKGSSTRLYYAEAYAPSFQVSVDVKYETLKYFADTTGNSYTAPGREHNNMLQPVTDDQKFMAEYGYETLSGVIPAAAQSFTVNAGSTVVTATVDYGEKNGLTLTTQVYEDGKEVEKPFTDSSTYLAGIEGVNQDYAGMYTYYNRDYGSGGWMYSITRGSETMFPNISASAFKLMPGDVITWNYSCDLGYDLGVPMKF